MRRVVLESPFAARTTAVDDLRVYMQRRMMESPQPSIEDVHAGWLDHDRCENITYARLCLLNCLQRGEGPIASHLLIPQVLDDLKPEERELGIAAGLAWHDVADAIVFYTDRGWSRGMRYAHEYAVARGLVVEYRSLTGAGNPPA